MITSRQFFHSYLIRFSIIDNLNPDWIKKLIIPFEFNIKQQLRFEIFDFDPYSNNEFLGRADLTLAQIVAANGGIYKQSLKTGSVNFNRVGGQIWLQSEEINSNKEIAFIQFSANNLGLN
jgi:Ca2+-dependent lipid-binding protein